MISENSIGEIIQWAAPIKTCYKKAPLKRMLNAGCGALANCSPTESNPLGFFRLSVDFRIPPLEFVLERTRAGMACPALEKGKQVSLHFSSN
jgi:hypothetical protein